jgi:dipeptidase E
LSINVIFKFLPTNKSDLNASHHILAFSSSRSGNSGYLETAVPVIKRFLDSKTTNIAFIPFASTDRNYTEYAIRVAEGLKDLSLKVNCALPENAKSIIEESHAIMIGGGNTFQLIHDLYELDLLDLIHKKVGNGTPYISWSAGSNILSPTIATTNDMPVIEPKSFKALNIFSFQTNPHYFNQKTEGFNGETRNQRLEEYLEINPACKIVGLPEGTGLQLENQLLTFFGEGSGVLFERKEGNFIKTQIKPGDNLSFLLQIMI